MGDENGRSQFYVERVVLDTDNIVRLSLEDGRTLALPKNRTELVLAANLEGGNVRVFTSRCYEGEQCLEILFADVVSVESGDGVVYSAKEDPYLH